MNKVLIAICVIVAAIAFMIDYARADVNIVVDKSAQVMIVETPTDQYVWEVSTGREGYDTPTGSFQPYLLKPMHYSSKYENARHVCQQGQ